MKQKPCSGFAERLSRVSVIAALIIATVHFVEAALFGIGTSLKLQSRIQANQIFDYPFDERAGQRPLVVLVDEQTLAINDWDWPVHYKNHAQILREIRQHKPFAVMVDILFAVYRDDEGFDELIQEIEAYDRDRIWLFFATPPADSTFELIPRLALSIDEFEYVERVPINLTNPSDNPSYGKWVSAL